VTILRLVVMGLVTAFLLSGCKSVQPVYNVVDHPLPDVVSKLSQEKAENIFIAAASKRGWVFRNTGDGELQGSLNIRAHSAKVTAKIGPKSFSITYHSSSNLHATEDRIDKNYNRWIHYLEQDVASALILGANLID
jgi:hypothetical protein